MVHYVKFLDLAGIDITFFTAHSTWSSFTFKAKKLELSFKDIHIAQAWRGCNTFRKFYNLAIRKNFGHEIISDFSKDKI